MGPSETGPASCLAAACARALRPGVPKWSAPHIIVPGRVWRGLGLLVESGVRPGPDTRRLWDAIDDPKVAEGACLRVRRGPRFQGGSRSPQKEQLPSPSLSLPPQSPQPADPPSFPDCLSTGFQSPDNAYNPVISLYPPKAGLSPPVLLGVGSPFPHRETGCSPAQPSPRAAERIIGLLWPHKWKAIVKDK